ncbi:MAG: cytosine permease [Halieaceae bacterium]
MNRDSTEFDSAAIPENQRQHWVGVAAVAVMVSLSVPTFVTGVELSATMGAESLITAVILGSAIIFVIGAMTGYVGARTGLNSYLLARVAFGDKGAACVNTAFALSLMGWFGINLNLFGHAATELIGHLIEPSPPPILLTVAATLGITITTLVGFKAINRLSLLLTPALLIIFLMLCGATEWPNASADVLFSSRDSAWSSGVSTTVGSIIIGAIIMPDVTRFLRKASSAVTVALLAFICAQPAVMIVAGLASQSMAAQDLNTLMLSLGMGSAALLLIMASSWILNALNLYSAALGLRASLPIPNPSLLIASTAAIGLVAGASNILAIFLDYLFYLSIVFVPVAGVVIADFFVVRRSQYIGAAFKHPRTVRVTALSSWGGGAIYALLATEDFILSLTGIAALDSLVLSGAIFLILSHMTLDRT